MLGMSNLSLAIMIAVAIAASMIFTSIFIIFYHDTKHEQLDRYIDYSYSGNTLRLALGYYRFMALSMLSFYILFTCSCLLLQADGNFIFSTGTHPILGGPIAVSLFSMDLVLRGGFFDVMEHFDLHLTTLHINKGYVWFWIYAFVFRMFYSLTLIKIFISFAWIYGKIRLARKATGEGRRQLRLFE